MPHFRLDPEYSSSWIQRTRDRFRHRQGKYEVTLLETHWDSPVPEDADLPAPLEPLKLRRQQNPGSRLLQLPPELMLHVIHFLSHSSMYMMRQTCQVLRKLANDINFDDFYWEDLRFKDEPRRLIGSICDQVRLVKRILLRRSLCEPCGNLFDTGELDARLRRLWQPIRCAGCNQNHPELLFPQDKRNCNICVGLLGHFDLCKHVKVSAKLQPDCRESIFGDGRSEVETRDGEDERGDGGVEGLKGRMEAVETEKKAL
ncbi:uncharacterized protein FFFS_15327 [Fusarium fujikuroi]|nr:uncharacterized protein FFFS_15327 [Fusarium fujikuroi]